MINFATEWKLIVWKRFVRVDLKITKDKISFSNLGAILFGVDSRK